MITSTRSVAAKTFRAYRSFLIMSGALLCLSNIGLASAAENATTVLRINVSVVEVVNPTRSKSEAPAAVTFSLTKQAKIVELRDEKVLGAKPKEKGTSILRTSTYTIE